MTAQGGCTPVIPLLFAAAVALAPQAFSSDDFRIETDVFVENQKQPIAQTLTLFSNDVVYDFMLTAPREITIFDRQRGRIILLDPERKFKAILTTGELVQFTAGIRARAAQDSRESLFGTEFTGHFDEESAVVVLEGENLVYRAVGLQPKFSSASGRFREFADWYAQLNAARPGNPPPFGRMELNRRLDELQFVPSQIDRTMKLPGRFGKEASKVSSRHSFTWLLSTTDGKRISDAGNYSATFQTVGIKEYWGLTDAAATTN